MIIYYYYIYYYLSLLFIISLQYDENNARTYLQHTRCAMDSISILVLLLIRLMIFVLFKAILWMSCRYIDRATSKKSMSCVVLFSSYLL